MRYKLIGGLFLLGLCVAVQPALAQKAGRGKAVGPRTDQAQAATFDPRAVNVLRKACDFLSAQQQFTFKGEVNDDQVFYGGKRLEASFELEAQVQRPDKLRVSGEGDVVNKLFVYDGRTITLYDKTRNVYATRTAPADIESALDQAQKDLGVTVALSDLASPRLYEHVTQNLQHALYVGVHKVRGIPCHHLAFDRGEVHVQVWVEAGDKPLFRKFIFTHRQAPGTPQWTATLTDWNLASQFQGAVFAFIPPKGAEMIDFAPPQTAARPKARPAAQGRKGVQP